MLDEEDPNYRKFEVADVFVRVGSGTASTTIDANDKPATSSIAQPHACDILQPNYTHLTHRPAGAGIDLFVDRFDVGVVEAPD